MTNGRQLVEIIESDPSGYLGEDVCSELLVPIEDREVCKAGDPPERICWRPVTPLETPPEQEREWLLTF